MITITTTIEKKDGEIVVRSHGKVTPDDTTPDIHEEMVAGVIAGSIRLASSTMANGGCGECDECKKAQSETPAEQAPAFAAAAPILLRDRSPSC